MTFNIHFFYHIATQFLFEWKVLRAKVVEKIKTIILCSVTFFPSKIVPFMR